MRLSLFLIPLLLSSACSDAATYGETVGTDQSSTSVRAEATAKSHGYGDAKAVSVVKSAEKDGGSWEFEYSWPAAVSANPYLAKQFAAERDKILAEERAEWEAALAESPKDCVSCRGRSFAKEWKVVADLPGWLSLSADVSTYTGGAHGMYGTDGLLFDKNAKAIRQPLDLFRSPAALQSAVEGRWCAALDIEREERRGEPVDKSDELFGGCPGIDELTVLLGSSNGKTFDRIGLIAGPYVAGSYAEGAYEVTLPVDDAVLAAVKSEFVGAFSVKR